MKNYLLFFDTETTGLPDWKVPSDAEHQPHIVQLAALLVDAKSREVLATMNEIVRPDGWEIPNEVAEIHGITQERATHEGIPEPEALRRLIGLWVGASRVAHNRTFDQRIVRIAMKRYRYETDVMEAWAEKNDFHCTMLMAKQVMRLGPKNRYGYKSPSLGEAYRYFLDSEMENAHDALSDARACMAIYWAMVDRGDVGAAA